MEKEPTKNYFEVLLLVLFIVLPSVCLVLVYFNRESFTSDIYKYSDHLASENLRNFLKDNSDMILYISDKYDITRYNFQNDFIEAIEELNLSDKLIFIDKREESSKEILKENGIVINFGKTPIILIIRDNKVVRYAFVDRMTRVEDIIDYEVFND